MCIAPGAVGALQPPSEHPQPSAPLLLLQGGGGIFIDSNYGGGDAHIFNTNFLDGNTATGVVSAPPHHTPARLNLVASAASERTSPPL